MSLKERLHSRLTKSRGFLEKLLVDFKTPQDWTHQVHPKANHALWVVGHLATVDNFFLNVLAPEKGKDLPGYNEKFGMGSQPSANASDYPSIDEVQQIFQERRAALLGVLESFSDEQLTEKMPPGSPDFLSDKASGFEMAAWHEGMHAGQVTVARRSLGHACLMDRLPTK
jgi:uncharacterized damage-inducible protein DinB